MAKLEKALVFTLRKLISPWSPRLCTRLMVGYFRRKGMRILGEPNYLSATVAFDGTDYSAIELNEGCTISSFVRILTHDWSPYTIGRGAGLQMDEPVGVFRGVAIGRYAFVGTCSVLMPGAEIGEGAIVGAGTVVRGKVEPWKIVIGSPAQVVGDSREWVGKVLHRQGKLELLQELRTRFPDLDLPQP